MLGLPAWLVSTVKLSNRDLIRLITYSLFINILALATPIFVLQVYDRVVFQAGLETLKALVLGVFIALIFDFALRQARSRLLQFISLKIDGRLGDTVFDRFSGLNLEDLEKKPAWFWQNIFRDVALIRNFIGGGTVIIFIDIPFSIIFISIIYLIAPPLIWIFVFSVAIFTILAWLAFKIARAATSAEQGSRAEVENLIIEIVSNRATVKSLNIAKHLKTVWLEKHSQTMERSLQRGRSADLFANVNVVLTMGVTVALTSFGAVAVLEQTMTIGSLIAANMLATRVIQPLSQLSLAWRTLNQFRGSRDRLGNLVLETDLLRKEVVGFSPLRAKVEIEGLHFAYEAEKKIFEGISLKFEPARIHAIVGNNGSGKSTLLKLMLDLYSPQTGKVLWDGADIRQFNPSQIANWCGYVPQECTLFTGSIRDNIAGFRDNVSDEEVINVARALGLHDDLSDLPSGYGTKIGENGRILSVGQRQKIALARGLATSPKVIMLDEPTSNLDRRSEHLLIGALKEKAKRDSSAVVIVTHSPAILANVDDITLLGAGKIQLSGPREDVLPKITRPIAADN
ncbi:MAG: ATP-binding cassette domain-containing protein [Rhodospirillaceae bacterium]